MLLWELAVNVAAVDVILHHEHRDGGGTRPAATACMTHLNVLGLLGLPARTLVHTHRVTALLGSLLTLFYVHRGSVWQTQLMLTLNN